MGTPAYEPTGNIILSGRQREWLVTADNDCLMELLDQEDDGELVMVCWIDGKQDEDVQRVPWEGGLLQPIVRLEEPEQAIEDLPETTEGSE